jgi:hypothetical protein
MVLQALIPLFPIGVGNGWFKQKGKEKGGGVDLEPKLLEVRHMLWLNSMTKFYYMSFLIFIWKLISLNVCGLSSN